MSAPTIEVRNLIAGDWVGQPEVDRRNPADPSDVVSLTTKGDQGTVADAVAAGVDAQRSWGRLPGPERGRILLDAAQLLRAREDEIARDLTREEGKTWAESLGEVRRAADVLTFFGGEGWRMAGTLHPASAPDTHIYTRKEPLGVVAAITPWNFPIAIPTWKIAPALVAGNSVVLKPASLTPVSTQHLAKALIDAGLPAGVLSLVHGSGAVIGDAIVEHPDVAAVSFTGSTAVGLGIHAKTSARRARVQLEMGGKNAMVVLDDADPQKAAKVAALGGFSLTGQACTATSRLICTPGILDAVTEALVEEAKDFRPGNGLDQSIRMGPVVSESQLATDQEYLEIARQEGAEIVTGGEEPDGLLQPAAVVRGVNRSHRIAQEEVFGPVISVMPASDLDEALDISNDVQFGLTASIVTNDLGAAHHFLERAEAGVVKVNRPNSGLDLNVPFGGIKDSSSNTFREQGSGAVDFYTWVKSVYMGY